MVHITPPKLFWRSCSLAGHWNCVPATSFWMAVCNPCVTSFCIPSFDQISGLPFLEDKAEKKWGNEKIYQDYKASTPILVPYFGKK